MTISPPLVSSRALQKLAEERCRCRHFSNRGKNTPPPPDWLWSRVEDRPCLSLSLFLGRFFPFSNCPSSLPTRLSSGETTKQKKRFLNFLCFGPENICPQKHPNIFQRLEEGEEHSTAAYTIHSPQWMCPKARQHLIKSIWTHM